MELPERAEGLEKRQLECGSGAAAREGRDDRREGRRSVPRVAINRRWPAGEGQEAVRGDRHRQMQRSGVRLSAACWREGGAALAGRCFQLVRAAPCTAARRARDLTPASRHPRMLAVLNRTNLMKRNRVPSSGPRRAGSGPSAGCVRTLRGRTAWLEGRSFRCHRGEIACFPSLPSLQRPSTTLSGLAARPSWPPHSTAVPVESRPNLIRTV